MLTNTHQLSLCESCNCAVQILMDDDGNRFCGKCKKSLQKDPLRRSRIISRKQKDKSR